MVCFGAVIYWLIFVGVTAGVFLLLRFVVADSLPPSKRRETDAARRARLKAVWEDEYRQMQAEARAQVDMAMAMSNAGESTATTIQEWRARRTPVKIAGVPGIHLLIDYHEVNDPDYTQREVLARRVTESRGWHYLDGFCLLRQQERCFRIDKMSEVVDLTTGEAFDRGEDWLNARMDA